MTVQEINNQRNEKGIYSWYAISRDGIHMITFYEGKYSFSKNKNVNKFYNEKGFAKRITILLNQGW
jgi:hypothetical protein